MILTVVILLVVLLALGLLFVPIQIFIDTDTGKYYVGLKGLAKASFEPDEKELLRVRLKVLFYEHYFCSCLSVGGADYFFCESDRCCFEIDDQSFQL